MNPRKDCTMASHWPGRGWEWTLLAALGALALAPSEAHPVGHGVGATAHMATLNPLESVAAGHRRVGEGDYLSVAVAQTASNETTTPEAMAEHMIWFIAEAAQKGARVVVFPEMAVVGYWPETINCTGCAQRLPLVEDTLARAANAHGVYVIFGIPHFVNNTHYYNTGLVVDPNGTKVYRQAKIAIAWAMDGMPGHWLDTFEIDGVPVAMMICASEFTPEIARLPALKGAKVLFYISYEGDVSKYVEKWQPSDPAPNAIFDVAYQVLPQARAIENHMYVVQSNAAETVRNIGTMGGSHGQSKIIDTLGHVLAEGPVFGEALLVATLDLSKASPPTFDRMREALPLFSKMWQTGMETVFSRMPIVMAAAAAGGEA